MVGIDLGQSGFFRKNSCQVRPGPGRMIGANGFRRTTGDNRVQGQSFRVEGDFWSVRCYVAWSISSHQFDETMQERGVEVDNSTLDRCVLAAGYAIPRARLPCRIQLANGRYVANTTLDG